ncbi:MAG: sugar ABC transporter permease [Clostridia bacterium]|nr:sugar ABC transporter permease [Clostridia bacterium]
MSNQIISLPKEKKSDKAIRFLKKNVPCWLYIVPVVLGIIFFTIVPMVTSLVYSFRGFYNPEMRGPEAAGGFSLSNFSYFFTPGSAYGMNTFLTSISTTFVFTIVSLALQILGSYGVALFLNQKTKGIKAFRILYYLPNLIPAVAGTMLWANITSTRGGYLNSLLEMVGLPGYTWYESSDSVLPTLLFVNIFSWGGTAIMWLSQMQNIPQEMYESADLDGANYFHKTFKITIPMSTAMMFYVIVTSMIGGIQAFTNVKPLYDKFQESKLNFIVVYIYDLAFGTIENGMSKACALSWILFVIIAIMTLILFKTSKKWVYYGEEV